MTDQLLQDDGLRFVDVLLEEELGAGADGSASAVVPRPRPAWWLAALVVFGLGVTVGAAVLQRLETDPVPLQEPVQRFVPFVPDDAQQLAEFLPQVAMVRVQPLRVLQRSFEREGVTEPGSEAHSVDPATLRLLRGPWTPLPAVPAAMTEPRIQVNGGNLLVASPDGALAPWARVQLITADGRCLQLCFEDPAVLCLDSAQWNPGADAARCLRRLLEQARQQGQDTRAIAESIAALRAVPATVRWLSCRQTTVDDLQDQLPRLQQVESLELDGEFDDRLAVVLMVLPRLRELRVHGTGFTAAGWTRLARLPNLRSLHLRGSVPGLTREALATLGARLETLAMVGDSLAPFPVAERLLPTIAQLPKLIELHLAVDCEARTDSAVRDRDPESIVATVLSMPNLRRLALAARNSDVSRWWPTLARTRLEKLRLPGVELDAAAVAQLATMSALRELDLREVTMPADARAALAQLRQLTRLDVGDNGWHHAEVQALQRALPRCSVRGAANVISFTTPLLRNEPSWSREESVLQPTGTAR
ncbi:MAG: hypothetical protein MUC36_00550 [Planctomycetes bacterium]|jgi:hypothetical protein|nr:hypothetical protein [Planctomycetota bacterium]